jgi:hypothetical protein
MSKCVATDKPLKLDFSTFEPILSAKCFGKGSGQGGNPKEEPKEEPRNILKPKNLRGSRNNKGNKVLETEDLELDFLY